MSAVRSTHRAGSRLSELSPFQPEQGPKGAVQPWGRLPEGAYGCVEWFPYVEHSGTPPARAARFPRQGRTPRR